jgi:hypothetical protein
MRTMIFDYKTVHPYRVPLICLGRTVAVTFKMIFYLSHSTLYNTGDTGVNDSSSLRRCDLLQQKTDHGLMMDLELINTKRRI